MRLIARTTNVTTWAYFATLGNRPPLKHSEPPSDKVDLGAWRRGGSVVDTHINLMVLLDAFVLVASTDFDLLCPR